MNNSVTNMVEPNTNIINNIVVMFNELNDDIKRRMLNIVTYVSTPALQVA